MAPSDGRAIVVRNLVRYHDTGDVELDAKGKDADYLSVSFRLVDGTVIDMALSEKGDGVDVRVVGTRGGTALNIEPRADNSVRLVGRPR